MSNDELNKIILKLTDEITVNVIEILLEHKELTDEQIVNILNGDTDNGEAEVEAEVEEEGVPRIALKEIRRSLYKLNERSLARYRRVRDKETGYFIYHWSPIWERITDLVIQRRKMSIKKLKQRLDYEERNLLYICDNGHTPVTFSDAFEMGFVCSTCNDALNQKENDATKEFLKTEIKKLEDLMKLGLNGFKTH